MTIGIAQRAMQKSCHRLTKHVASAVQLFSCSSIGLSGFQSTSSKHTASFWTNACIVNSKNQHCVLGLVTKQSQCCQCRASECLYNMDTCIVAFLHTAYVHVFACCCSMAFLHVGQALMNAHHMNPTYANTNLLHCMPRVCMNTMLQCCIDCGCLISRL